MFDSYIVNTYKSELTEIKKASDRYKEAEEKFYKAKSLNENVKEIFPDVEFQFRKEAA